MDLDGENILRFDLSSPPSLSYLNGYRLKIKLIDTKMRDGVETAQSALHIFITGNPGSVIAAQYGSSKITVFVWGKNIILKFLGNTK